MIASAEFCNPHILNIRPPIPLHTRFFSFKVAFVTFKCFGYYSALMVNLNPVVKGKCFHLDGPCGSLCGTLGELCGGAVWEEGGDLRGSGSGKKGIKRTPALLRAAGPAVSLVHLPPHGEVSPPGHRSPALSGR